MTTTPEPGQRAPDDIEALIDDAMRLARHPVNDEAGARALLDAALRRLAGELRWAKQSNDQLDADYIAFRDRATSAEARVAVLEEVVRDLLALLGELPVSIDRHEMQRIRRARAALAEGGR